MSVDSSSVSPPIQIHDEQLFLLTPIRTFQNVPTSDYFLSTSIHSESPFKITDCGQFLPIIHGRPVVCGSHFNEEEVGSNCCIEVVFWPAWGKLWGGLVRGRGGQSGRQSWEFGVQRGSKVGRGDLAGRLGTNLKFRFGAPTSIHRSKFDLRLNAGGEG